MARLRSALREYFPAALLAFEDLDAPDALELLGRAPDPDRAARLRQTVIALPASAPVGACRGPSPQLRNMLRAPELRQPPAVQNAYAAIVASEVAIITLNIEIDELGAVVADHFGRHRDAEIYLSLPGLGVILARPDPRRVRRRPGPLRRRESPQELRRHLTDHPRLRHQESRAGPLRPQPPARRRRAPMGVLLHARLTRSTRLLPSSSATAGSATKPRYANSPTASSASCTAA